ncbi:MAG TPA: GNAT family N-acetyltransferase, partial [Trebonia sp.]
MDPVSVLAGTVADQEADSAAVRAATAAHPRFLVSAATGYGSPLSRATEPTADDLGAIVAALVSEAHAGDATPVVLHCPADDPLLSALAAAEFTIGVTDLYPTLQLPGAGLDDYLAALPRGRRSAVRRELRAGASGTAEIYVGETARPHLAAAARLSAHAYRQRGQPADDDRARPIYRRLLDECGDDFALTLVSDGSGPVASACLVAGKTDLLLYSAGLELPRSQAVAGYFNAAYYLPIEFAYQRGLRRILLGPTGWHTKRLRGARFTPLCSAVPTAAAELAALLTATDQRLRATLGQLNGS